MRNVQSKKVSFIAVKRVHIDCNFSIYFSGENGQIMTIANVVKIRNKVFTKEITDKADAVSAGKK